MWDTDDIAVPDSWDEGEETAVDVYGTANEGSTTEGDEMEHSLSGLDDSLLELVSNETETSEDSGYDFLNTPTNEEDKDFKASPEEATEMTEEKEEQKEVNTHKDTDETWTSDSFLPSHRQTDDVTPC